MVKDDGPPAISGMQLGEVMGVCTLMGYLLNCWSMLVITTNCINQILRVEA